MRPSLCVALFLTACGGEPAPPAGVTLAITSLSVREAMAELGRATGRPHAIDASAEPVADCARFSLSVPEPTPAEAVIALFARTVSSSRFALASGPEGLVLSFSGGPPPDGCGESPHTPSFPAPSLPDPTVVRPEVAAEWADAIHIVSDGETEITRAARDALLADPRTPTSIRILPHVEEGRPVGMRLYGIRRTSVAGALGLQNGDTILDLNGRSVATAEGALEAYSELRSDRIEVHLLRRGAPRTLIVTVVETLSAPSAPSPPPP